MSRDVTQATAALVTSWTRSTAPDGAAIILPGHRQGYHAVTVAPKCAPARMACLRGRDAAPFLATACHDIRQLHQFWPQCLGTTLVLPSPHCRRQHNARYEITYRVSRSCCCNRHFSESSTRETKSARTPMTGASKKPRHCRIHSSPNEARGSRISSSPWAASAPSLSCSSLLAARLLASAGLPGV